MPIQDREDTWCGVIFSCEGMRAHRYWSILCRKSDQQAIDGWKGTYGMLSIQCFDTIFDSIELLAAPSKLGVPDVG